MVSSFPMSILVTKLQIAVDDSLLAHDVIYLVCEGLDTFATIYINEVEVGSSQNMFVRYEFDVKDQLKVELAITRKN
jgi:beta-mannosidase